MENKDILKNSIRELYNEEIDKLCKISDEVYELLIKNGYKVKVINSPTAKVGNKVVTVKALRCEIFNSRDSKSKRIYKNIIKCIKDKEKQTIILYLTAIDTLNPVLVLDKDPTIVLFDILKEGNGVLDDK